MLQSLPNDTPSWSSKSFCIEDLWRRKGEADYGVAFKLRAPKIPLVSFWNTVMDLGVTYFGKTPISTQARQELPLYTLLVCFVLNFLHPTGNARPGAFVNTCNWAVMLGNRWKVDRADNFLVMLVILLWSASCEMACVRIVFWLAWAGEGWTRQAPMPCHVVRKVSISDDTEVFTYVPEPADGEAWKEGAVGNRAK